MGKPVVEHDRLKLLLQTIKESAQFEDDEIAAVFCALRFIPKNLISEFGGGFALSGLVKLLHKDEEGLSNVPAKPKTTSLELSDGTKADFEV